MNFQTSLGLQWKLAAVYVAVSLLSAGTVALVYLLGTSLGYQPAAALVAGVCAGAVAGLVLSGYGFAVARSIKLRLWEMGDLADHIARGDFSVRLPEGEPDEIGVLEAQLNQMARHLQEAMANLRRLAEQNQRLAEEARRGAALEERARLARDLHDTVNQQLFVLTMRSAAARRKLEKLGGEALEMVPELAALEELARQAHTQTRELILQLRPTTLEQQGIGPALAEYVKTCSAREGWEALGEIDTAIRVRGRTGEALFRVAQEALNNVSKHAGAKQVRVDLQREEERLVLRIRDDGKGFDPRAGVRPTSVGLVGMKERVSALGGSVQVRSAPGQGTEVRAVLPLPSEEVEPHDPVDAG